MIFPPQLEFNIRKAVRGMSLKWVFKGVLKGNTISEKAGWYIPPLSHKLG